MRVRKTYGIYLASAALAAPLTLTPAWGATEDDTIVVTAQRREESVLNVPLSIQATSGETLQETGIKQITDLQFTTPGYNVSDSNGYTQIFIRGVGNAIFVGADPSVATFIDDVPRIYGSMVNNFVNVERVEVLKGAQGGLYGRNATGGVVNIITRQPSTEDRRMDARLAFASHNTVEAEAYLNLPLADFAALSVAFQRRDSDPYFENIAPHNPYTAAMFPGVVGGITFIPNHPNGLPPAFSVPGFGDFYPYTAQQTANFFNSGVNAEDVGDQNFYAVDGKLLIRPTDTFKITFAGDFSNKDDSQGNAQFQVAPAYELNALRGTFAAFGIPTNFPDDLIIGNPPKFKVANGTPGFVRLKDWGVSATAVLGLSNIDLTSITAYRKQHTEFLDDLGASSVPFTSAFVDNRKHYFYQEARAVSAFEGPFQFIAGASYLNSYFNGATDVSVLTPLLSFPVARAIDRIKNYSAYLQVAYDFTEDLTLTASGRYVYEKNSAFFPLSNTPLSFTQEKFLPSATLSYRLAGGNVYARWARGFKSGGINPVADPTAFEGHLSSGSVFEGELVDTFEAGFRGNLLDNRVQVTAAVFYNDYANLHTAAHARAEKAATVILAIINAGTARSYGVEGTVSWRATPSLTFTAAAGYLNAKYKNFSHPGDEILDPFDLSGHVMTNSPEFQGSFNANLDQPINDRINLVANVLVSHTSSVFYQVSGNHCDPGEIVGVTCLPDAIGEPYTLVNARLGFKTSDNRVGLALFANNLFNEAYVTFGNSNAGNTTQFTWGNPRIIGVEGTLHF
jgi:iron complex outermembrane recepter protein